MRRCSVGTIRFEGLFRLGFIPVAEETGLIVAIGEWVLRTACFQAENWPADLSVAVNLSAVQFKHGDIVTTFKLRWPRQACERVVSKLEITESVLLRDTPGTLAVLHQLRAMGIDVALDDFGTGYSSLSYLHSFPFSKIKIDQSFVRDLLTNKEFNVDSASGNRPWEEPRYKNHRRGRRDAGNN